MLPFLHSLPSLFPTFLLNKGTLPITGICTDSRKINKGDLFIALVGDKFNAHLFIKDVLPLASGIVFSESLSLEHLPKEISFFKVPNTVEFYQLIAKEYLKTKPLLKKIAITGSAGKTSTKEWLALLLSSTYTVYKTPSNLNNQIGLPFSCLQVREEQIAIFELGSGKPNDISILRDIISPDIGIITSVGEAHLEFFGSLQAIAKEKQNLCQGTSLCIVPKRILFSSTLFKKAHKVEEKDIFTTIHPLNEKGFKLSLRENSFIFPFFGEYNLSNFTLATYTSLKLGVSPENILKVHFPPLPSYRSLIKKKGSSTLLLDCYNANPLSMKASLLAVSNFTPKPTLILGDMLELGEKAKEYHQDLGLFLKDLGFLKIFFIGEQMQVAYISYPHKKLSLWAKKLEELKKEISACFRDTGYIFVKGSRGIHLEDIENW